MDPMTGGGHTRLVTHSVFHPSRRNSRLRSRPRRARQEPGGPVAGDRESDSETVGWHSIRRSPLPDEADGIIVEMPCGGAGQVTLGSVIVAGGKAYRIDSLSCPDRHGSGRGASGPLIKSRSAPISR